MEIVYKQYQDQKMSMNKTKTCKQGYNQEILSLPLSPNCFKARNF